MPSRGVLLTTVRQQRGVAELHEHGAVGQLGEPAGLERHDQAGVVDGPETRIASPWGAAIGTLSLVVAARRRFPVVRVRTVRRERRPGLGD